MSGEEQAIARTRFARLCAFYQRLGEGASDVQVGCMLSEEEARDVWRATAVAGFRRGGANMTDGKPEQPWILQLLQDRKTERFRVALEKIATRKSELESMSPDQALVALRDVVAIAQGALSE
jgi:hypothetical protein